MADLAFDIHEKYQHLAADRQVRLRLSVADDLPRVFADIGLVERVVQNLMDNALKFTPAGGEVTIELTADAHDVLVAVKDTGRGIPAHEVAHVFERYRQATPTQSGEGAGLGLAIARKILEIHDATIRVVSQPNQMTVFQFNLLAFDR